MNITSPTARVAQARANGGIFRLCTPGTGQTISWEFMDEAQVAWRCTKEIDNSVTFSDWVDATDGEGTGKVNRLTFRPGGRVDMIAAIRLRGVAPRVLTGTIDPTASTSVVGVGTLFLTELIPGDKIVVNGETRQVETITDDTNLTVTVAFTNTDNDISPTKVFAIQAWADSNNNQVMTLDHEGRLGLGTPCPTAWLQVTRTTEQLRLGYDVNNYASFTVGSSGQLTISKPVKLSAGYTVASLPAGSVGMRAYVTDATAPTFLGALTGGGAVVCPVFHNGSAWVAG